MLSKDDLSREIFRWLPGTALLVALLLGRDGFAYAQASTASATIAGYVRDTSGNRVPDARVIVEGTQVETRTNNEGYYALLGVPYSARITLVSLYVAAIGYEPARRERVALHPGDTVLHSVRLTPLARVGWIEFVASDKRSYAVYEVQDSTFLGRTSFKYTQRAQATFTYLLKGASGVVICKDTLTLEQYDLVRMRCDLRRRKFLRESPG